ncbi:MAG TPA: hypothetical protein DEZ09_02055, partial [Holosporales bacterium]|nr:hypothetical protein [Holosporales bacterium]
MKFFKFFLVVISGFLMGGTHGHTAPGGEEWGPGPNTRLQYDPLVGLPYWSDGSQAELDLNFVKKNLPLSESSTGWVFASAPLSSRQKRKEEALRRSLFLPETEERAQHNHPLDDNAGPFLRLRHFSWVPECWVTSREPTFVPNPLNAGWGCVGLLETSLFGPDGGISRRYVGSGVLIAPNIVLTAGHNLWCRHLNSAYSQITFHPARSDPYTFPHAVASTFFVVDPGFISSAGEDYQKHDLGIVILSQHIGREVGWASYGFLPDEHLKTQVLDLVGYPSSVLRDGMAVSASGEMYHASGPVIDVTPEQVFHFINSSPGHSGGPLIDRHKCVRAIHTYGGTIRSGNCATRISQEKERAIQEWISANGFQINVDFPAFRTRTFQREAAPLREEMTSLSHNLRKRKESEPSSESMGNISSKIKK